MSYQLDLKSIREHRIRKGLTMQDMSDALGLEGKSSYSKREAGDTKFKTSELPVLVKLLGFSSIEKIFVSELTKSKLIKQDA